MVRSLRSSCFSKSHFGVESDTSNGVDNQNDLPTSRQLGSTRRSSRYGPELLPAIQFLLDRFPVVAPTEELHQMLHCVIQTTNAQKVIRSCIGTSGCRDLFSWDLVAKLTGALANLVRILLRCKLS